MFPVSLPATQPNHLYGSGEDSVEHDVTQTPVIASQTVSAGPFSTIPEELFARILDLTPDPPPGMAAVSKRLE